MEDYQNGHFFVAFIKHRHLETLTSIRCSNESYENFEIWLRIGFSSPLIFNHFQLLARCTRAFFNYPRFLLEEDTLLVYPNESY